jgi:hypothetical protein
MDYLIQHARDNVWCSPRQDRQFILRPKRISSNGGEVVQIEVDWLQVYLPDKLNYYHVYQISNLHADFLGLFPTDNKWMSLTDVCNKMGMIADLYTNKGILLPKFETYYMVTKSHNLIIATRDRDALLNVDYNTEDVYFRVYTNAYFQTVRAKNMKEKIVTKGKSPATTNEILAMQTEFKAYQKKTPGFTWAVINGYYYEEISLLTCKVGDLVEWVYDASIKKVIEFGISVLPTFDSDRDSERKYLLHYAGVSSTIDYQQDIEMFLIERPSDGRRLNGLYHHKNTAAALRQVTHKDYATSVQLVNAFVDDHPVWSDPKRLRFKLFFRESGLIRPTIFEKNRIHELYKLKDTDILPALIGDNATVSSWKASVLENSDYPRIMEQPTLSTVTRQMVQSAYGYNAMSKILGDTPAKVSLQNGQKMADLPRGLYENSTIYEYDVNGLLLGWYYHSVGTKYVATNAACDLVEGISGKVDRLLDEVYDTQNQTLDPKLNYRMYICDKLNGISQNNWRDVTGSNQYSLINNQLQWLLNMNNYTTLVRSDKNALGYAFQLPCRDGLITFDITKLAKRGNVTALQYQDVPMGELDIFLNGRSLIEKVDYVAKGKKVFIYNKRFLINPETQKQEIVVRSSGFCKTDLTRETAEDIGFVKWELLSRNSTFNLRDDRVLRIIVDGRLRHRDSLLFSEEDQAYLLPNSLNGDPYLIRDLVVPMRSVSDGDTYSLREQSRVIDREISAYLTSKLPEPVPSVPNVLEELYPIFSPFLCKIIYDLVDGVIDINQLKVQYDNDFVRSVCTPYEYILEYDPTQTANAFDPNYVIVHPIHHNNVMNVDVYHYKFIQTVISIYMAGKVQLNNFLRLASI